MKSHWKLDPEITYLNHGSFGPTPGVVKESQLKWRQRLEANPMQFFVREQEFLLEESTEKLGQFLGCDGKDLIYVDNATFGMNIVANSFPLNAGDEVLLTDHEYGSVKRIWQDYLSPVGAKVVIGNLPDYMENQDQVARSFVEQASEKTKLIVISHVTSQTSVVLPVKKICELAKAKGIAVCIDGPHAIAMQDLNLSQIDCDFYTASCHKWLCAPFGTGFLYVHPRWQGKLRPNITSWGGTMCGREKSWKDEFLWQGTRDLSAFLAVPDAIDFMQQYGLEKFRKQSHELAAYARKRLVEICETKPCCADSIQWYGSMITVPLPDYVPAPTSYTGQPHPLHRALYENHRIEPHVFKWKKSMQLRVSCHLYNDKDDIDRLCESLKLELARKCWK
ncbi:MAG: aminotransferase class V-fold PLP-dependent enzyme [Planctomycetaceae bacterium]|nr:aminotransferase class V-fold PLP-dependent enzyme [Planctomycetaceae bacterium]